MGSEITGDGDEDMPAFVGVARAELSHAGVQRLVGMETCVLAQQRPRQRGDQRLHRVTKREVTRDKTRGEIDLPLPGAQRHPAVTRTHQGHRFTP